MYLCYNSSHSYKDITILKLKEIKQSSFILVIIVVFLLVDIIGYIVVKNHITIDNNKNIEILQLKIKNQTSNLLSQLLYQHQIQTIELPKKHREVDRYLKDKSDLLNIDLKEIHDIINKDLAKETYHIYLSNKNFVIKNATYKEDLEFDLTFDKKRILEDDKKNIISPSVPFYKNTAEKFFSYTTSILKKDNKHLGVLELSYIYQNTKKQYNSIEKLLSKYPNVKDVKAFTKDDSGLIGMIEFKNNLKITKSLNDMFEENKIGTNIYNSLKDKEHIQKDEVVDSIPYKLILVKANNPIFPKTKMYYQILFDQTQYYDDLKQLNYIVMFITILGVMAIIILVKIRDKETKLTQQDKFVQNSLHEIRTPLSIITLNNQLRTKEFGDDEYGNEIDSALKTLQNSYNDMSFIVTNDKVNYNIENINLGEIVQERVNYFTNIAKSNNKTLKLQSDSNMSMDISLVEITRLIDNNLSNSIKYSSKNSIIKITLKDDKLSFHNFGTPIKDKVKIFEKYTRENNVLGGYGLGLNIIKQIAHKYNIDIDLKSDEKNGTNFTYTFK